MYSSSRSLIPTWIVVVTCLGLGMREMTSAKTASAKFTGTAGCLPPDTLASDLRDELIDLMGRSDQLADTILAAEGVARVPASQIVIVSDTTLCRRASNAYSAAVQESDEDRKVHAIRAGIRYLVMDPSHHAGSYKVGVTFDSSFSQTVSTFLY